jgi:hypothetical protein
MENRDESLARPGCNNIEAPVTTPTQFVVTDAHSIRYQKNQHQAREEEPHKLTVPTELWPDLQPE